MVDQVTKVTMMRQCGRALRSTQALTHALTHIVCARNVHTQCKGSHGRREHGSARAVVVTASTSVQGQSWPPRARQCKDIRGCREHVSARAVVTTASMSVQGQSWLSRARECKGSRGHRKHVSARAVLTASSMSVEDSCGCCEYVSARVVVVAVNTPA